MDNYGFPTVLFIRRILSERERVKLWERERVKLYLQALGSTPAVKVVAREACQGHSTWVEKSILPSLQPAVAYYTNTLGEGKSQAIPAGIWLYTCDTGSGL
jgi:hypothetical protein